MNVTWVQIAYVIFFVLGVASFWLVRPSYAVLWCVLGGWALLPNGEYPPPWDDRGHPYWILCLALPGQMLVSKAWVGPLAALAGVFLRDRGRGGILAYRFHWMDLIPIAWSMSPIATGLLRESAAPSSPPGWVASIYLLAAWGIPWFLGRIYFSSPHGRLLLVKGLAWSAAAYLPVSLIEGLCGPKLYGWVYGAHPFAAVGEERYIGFRPLGLLEDGNQLGMWLMGGALCAIWLAWTQREGNRTWCWVLAGVTTFQALAAQSMGAILLLLVGLGALAVTRWVSLRVLVVVGALMLVLGAGVYLSGKVPVGRLKQTAVGQKFVQTFKEAGRGSFTWRVGQDQKFLKLATAHPLTGHGQWDWWKEQKARPWGLELLVLGQFGLIGLMLAYATVGLPAFWMGVRITRKSPPELAAAVLLLVLLGLMVVDSLLNAFLLLPIVMASGSLVPAPAKTGGSMEVPASAAGRTVGQSRGLDV